MKRTTALFLAILIALSLTACGASFTCSSCGKKTAQAYYTFWGSRDTVLCKSCAVQYWGDAFTEDLRIK